MWNSSPRPLRALVTKPANSAASPSAIAVRLRVTSPMATARISIETLRGWPFSLSSDSCFSPTSRAGRPAGV
jgi:hypothetical protein